MQVIMLTSSLLGTRVTLLPTKLWQLRQQRRLLMRWASHSWRRVPKTPSTWSRPSWLWLHPSRIGWPANQPRPTLGQRPCRSAGNPSTRRRLAACPKIASFLWFLVTISTVCARTQMYLHYS
uniref:Uncharacterized protein n=1 Tax=Zea mays TaxID=4577 RepID=B4FQU8_MAIZE|nr:unknown [Zea mays]